MYLADWHYRLLLLLIMQAYGRRVTHFYACLSAATLYQNFERTAHLQVRFTEAEIKNSGRTAKDILTSVRFNCVEAKETTASVKNHLPVAAYNHALYHIATCVDG